MTQEDKRAYNYARDRLANDDYPVYSDEYELELAYKAGIEDAKNHPNWISVEDELPKINWTMSDTVVVTDGDGGLRLAWYHQDEGWHFATELPFEPTHWMPLPKMPVLSNLENIGKDLKGGKQ